MIFIFQTQIFEKIYLQPQKVIFSICFKHQKSKLHEGMTNFNSFASKWQALKVAWADSTTFRLVKG